MELNLTDDFFTDPYVKRDSLDIPECFGDYDKHKKLCSTYCALSIQCCVLHARNPGIDILEKLLINNQYAIKIN